MVQEREWGSLGQSLKRNMEMLALISGEKLLNTLFVLVVWACIIAVLWWGLNKCKPGEPWMQVCTVILVILTVVVLINILLGLIGHPIVQF